MLAQLCRPSRPDRSRRSLRAALPLLGLPLFLLAATPPAGAAGLSFHEQSLELPGAPAALIPADFDGDGLRDLAVVVVYTEWDQIGIEELTEMDQVAGLVEVLTIVPTLMDRREVRLYRRLPDGSLAPAGAPLPLPLDVSTLEPGPPGVPALALTDGGASALRLGADGELTFEPLLEGLGEAPVFAGTGTFLAGLDLVREITGDSVEDLLLPTADGIAIVPGRRAADGGGLAPEPIARVPYPVDHEGSEGTQDALARDIPLPTPLDVNGDGLPDLLFRKPGGGDGGLDGATVALQSRRTGEDRFAAPAPIPAPSRGHDREEGNRVWIGPVDPAPGAELVTTASLDEEDAGVRKEMEQVREPRFRVRLHPLGEGSPLTPATAPSRTFEVKGWISSGGGDDETRFVLPGGFRDLNGDGRADLVTVTNDITLFKAMSVLATRRLSLELGFHVWCQQPHGDFVRAPGEPLTSRLTIHLNDLEIRQRSLFAGDFDGDGRHDFLQLGASGRTREVGIHLGRPDCSYPERPDTTVRLPQPLRDLALAEVLDLDGDGRDDLIITHPEPTDEAGVSPTVRLDLYTARVSGAREEARP